MRSEESSSLARETGIDISDSTYRRSCLKHGTSREHPQLHIRQLLAEGHVRYVIVCNRKADVHNGWAMIRLIEILQASMLTYIRG
jgi:hypothetical protein